MKDVCEVRGGRGRAVVRFLRAGHRGGGLFLSLKPPREGVLIDGIAQIRDYRYVRGGDGRVRGEAGF